ncbi:MAG: hypothetical protein Kow0069_29660 [Promethearchaeota archaeon]
MISPMRVCLVYPNFGGDLIPSLGLATLASYVNPRHPCKVVDMTFHNRDWQEHLTREVAQFKPGVVGVSCVTFNLQRSLEIASRIKELWPEVFVLFGGVHPTLLPGETLAHPQVDGVVLGDGEETLVEVLERLEGGQGLEGVRGLWYKDERGSTVKNPRRECLFDLDALPFVDWDLWDLDAYLLNPFAHKELPISASRGCPFKCTFCSNAALERDSKGKHYRIMSPKRVIEEIEYQTKKYAGKVRWLFFWDDVFYPRWRDFREFCELYEKAGLHRRFFWSVNTRVDLVTERWASLAARAGCFYVRLGVETGNEKLRALVLGKRISDRQVSRARSILAERDVLVRFNLMLGVPGDDARTLRETAGIVKREKPDYYFFAIYQPLPRTELVARLEELGWRVDASQWANNRNFFDRALVSTPTLKARHVRLYQRLQVARAGFEFFRRAVKLGGTVFFRDLLLYFTRWRRQYNANPWLLATATLRNYMKAAWLGRRRSKE